MSLNLVSSSLQALPAIGAPSNLQELNKLIKTRPEMMDFVVDAFFSQYGTLNAKSSLLTLLLNGPNSKVGLKMGSNKGGYTVSSMKLGREVSQYMVQWQTKVMTAAATVVTEILSPLDSNEQNTAVYGRNGNPVTIKVDKNYWTKGTFVNYGTNINFGLFRVTNDPIQIGPYFQYKIVDANPAMLGIPASILYVGNRLYSAFTAVSDNSEDGGRALMTTTMTDSSTLTKIAVKYDVEGFTARQSLQNWKAGAILGLNFKDDNGKMMSGKYYASYLDIITWKQLLYDSENAMLLSRANNSLKDEGGLPIRLGTGLYQSLEKSPFNVTFSNNNDIIDILSETLKNIFRTRVDVADRKKVKIYGGQEFMASFSSGVNNIIKNSPFTFVDPKQLGILTNISSESTPNGLGFGYQIVNVLFNNNIMVEVHHSATFDNEILNTETDPQTGAPKSSSNFLVQICDETVNNIEMVHIPSEMKYGYLEGLDGLGGPRQGGMVSKLSEGFGFRGTMSCGIILKDPSAFIWFRKI